MTPFTVGRTINPAGEPLYRAARRIRLEIEAEMVARAELADDPAALQIVGLLLQLEGIARAGARPPLELVAPRGRDSAPERQAKA